MRSSFELSFAACAACIGMILALGCAESAGPAAGAGGTSGAGGTGGAGGGAGEGGRGGGPSCRDVAECSDRNSCTVDECVEGACQSLPVEDGSPCGEGAGSCLAGSCRGVFPCTERGIRDAIEVGGGPHTFDCDGPTTVPTEAEIAIVDDVILDGEGLLSVDGADSHRVFSVPTHPSVELRRMTIEGGATTGEGAGLRNLGRLLLDEVTVRNNTARNDFNGSGNLGRTGNGGGIANEGELTLVDCLVSGNTARHDDESSFQSSAQANGGGIFNRGALRLTNTTVTANLATNGGGVTSDGAGSEVSVTGSTFEANAAVHPDNLATSGGGLLIGETSRLELHSSELRGNEAVLGGGVEVRGLATITGTRFVDNQARGGGGIRNLGETRVVDCTVRLHDAQQGAGIENVGARMRPGPRLTIERTTVSNNFAAVGGGGIFSSGEIDNPPAELVIVNSTISNNRAQNAGGGLWNFYSVMTMVHTTMAGNEAPIGDLANGNADSVIRGSIISGDCRLMEPLISGGHNVESPASTCGFDQETDQPEVAFEDLKLEVLADAGGPTETHALEAGSVAIDAVDPGSCRDADESPLATDQRGEPRSGLLACDAGSYEVQ